LAEALLLLGTKRTVVVHGSDGLDEVTLSGPTRVIEAAEGQLHRFEWTPEDFGLESASKDALLVNDPAESAAMIAEIFAGRRGPARDIVLANAAAALWTVDPSNTLRHWAEVAAETVDTGKAKKLLQRLAEKSHQ
jgi:anthranilate phosphoribosyltransferase